MLEADVRSKDWLKTIPKEKTGIVIMEGISMYMSQEELKGSEKVIFQKVYGGKISKKMYRLYEYIEATN